MIILSMKDKSVIGMKIPANGIICKEQGPFTSSIILSYETRTGYKLSTGGSPSS